MGKLFTAMESLVSDISAGDGNTAKPFLQCSGLTYSLKVFKIIFINTMESLVSDISAGARNTAKPVLQCSG